MHSLENSKVSNTITCDEFNAKKPKENTYLNFIRKGNLNMLVLAHININTLVQQITNNIDILMISETKLDNSFPDLSKKKWLLCGTYNPHRNNIGNHLDSLSKNVALYSSAYDNYIVFGGFNVEADSKEMSSFCDTFDLTSFKNHV